MSSRELRILLVMEQCNPEQPSVPRLGFHFFQELKKKAHVTLCTHGRNERALEKVREKSDDIVYMHESLLSRWYYRWLSPLVNISGVNWPLSHALFYPIYSEFNRSVYKRFCKDVSEQKYDVVHAMTPIIPRYPVKLVKACMSTPFILGPVNGGLSFPKGFGHVAKKEHDAFNLLRSFCWLLPGYRKTYVKADRILAGSIDTREAIAKMFSLGKDKLQLFHENGVESAFFASSPQSHRDRDTYELLFVGRLVPYKGLDILLEAIGRLEENLKSQVRLRIAGDGPEKKNLEQMVEKLCLTHLVSFCGWLQGEELASIYKQSNIFCFPSIREFGGAVVLEAMAAGLPCIVANHGGIAEYVTEETGFKVSLLSREELINGLKEKIAVLINNPELLSEMSKKCIQRAKEFEWENKITRLLKIYEEVQQQKRLC